MNKRLATALALLALGTGALPSHAFSLLSTGFTYQGRLNDGASPANGTYDLVFTAYDAADPSGIVVAGPVTNAATVVSNGVFTVTVDFGTNTSTIFNFSERWLEIGARTNGAGSFTTLTPRQRVSATPYAWSAVNAGTLLGNLPASQVQGTLSLAQLPAGVLTNNQTGVSLSGTFSGNGAGLTNLSATTLGGVSSNGFWQATGNAGTIAGANFIGTTDNQPLEVRVNNTRAFRIEPASVPSLEGGYFQNSTHGFTSAAIVGGGTSGSINEIFGDYGFIGAGHGAKVGSFSAVVNGAYNDANVQFSFIGSGQNNTNRGLYSFIGSGYNNAAMSLYSAIGSGATNLATGWASTIVGGVQNTNNGDYSSIAGGWLNLIQFNAPGTTVGAGYSNAVLHDAYFTTIGGGAYNVVMPFASEVTIGGGGGNVVGTNANLSTISGGNSNLIGRLAIGAVIGGGDKNSVDISGGFATISGGALNAVGGSAIYTTISGGYSNAIGAQAIFSSIGGGRNNAIQPFTPYATIGGGSNNFSAGSISTISGGANNTATGAGAFIGGGGSDGVVVLGNVASGPASVIGGGLSNTNSGYTSVIGGGYGNIASGGSATVGGGVNNVASGDGSTVAGGLSQNVASGSDSTIGGGAGNTASGYGATIGGGVNNQATNLYATIPGGVLNYAYGYYSFAAGQQAQALHSGAFVWADSEGTPFPSTASDQFCIRAQGGLQLHTNTSVFFGSQTRQMVNLWGTHYGIGVQSFTTYFRSDGGFSWFVGGVHNDGQNNPGSGGIEFMRVSTGGARIMSVNNWDVTGTEGDLRVGNDTYRFKIGVATNGGGAGDVWMRAHGGSGRIFVKTPGGTTIYSNEGQTLGVSLAANGTAWATVSDRNAKKDFAPIDSRQILEKLAAMPITQWHYKWEEESVTPHIGPMAQDFKAAFYPGTDDKSITTQEADGVAFAAIKGLNEKVESENATLRTENAELKKRLDRLERLVDEKFAHSAAAADLSLR